MPDITRRKFLELSLKSTPHIIMAKEGVSTILAVLYEG